MARQGIRINVGANAEQVYQEITRQARRAEDALRRTPIRLDTKSFGAFRSITADIDRFDKSLTRMSAVIQTFGQSAAILFGIQNAFAALVRETVNVEKTITDIGVVFGKSAKELEDFSNGLFNVAKQTGQTFDSTAEAAKEFSRQGLSVEETLKRTRDAMILVRTTGGDVESAVKNLTATVNTFRNEMLDTTKVVNTFRNVDTGFAVSAQDLADGIQRAGASASDAQVNFNELNALITSLQQNTARGGAVIGNSLKSIFTRLQRTDTLDALEGIGVATKELDGSIRPAIEILTDLSKTIDTLSDAQRAQIKETVAGVYQINALSALLQDLGGGYSIYSQALQTANNTTNEAIVSNEKLNQTLAATLNETVVNLTQFASAVGEGAIAPTIQKLLGTLNAAFDSFNNSNDGIGQKIGQGIIEGIGNFISGPGLIFLVASVAKISRLVLKGAADQFKATLNLSRNNERILDVQQRILAVLQNQDPAIQRAIQGARSREQLEARIFEIINAQNRAISLQDSLTRGIAGRAVAGRIPNARNIPNMATDDAPLKAAIGKEIASLTDLGYSPTEAARSIRVQSSNRLVSRDNPRGLGVFNTLQGQYNVNKAISDHSGIPNMAREEDLILRLLRTNLPGIGRQPLVGSSGRDLSNLNLSSLRNIPLKSIEDISKGFANAAEVINRNRANIQNAPRLLRDISSAQSILFREVNQRAIGGRPIPNEVIGEFRNRRADAGYYAMADRRQQNAAARREQARREAAAETRARRLRFVQEERARREIARREEVDRQRNERRDRRNTRLGYGSLAVPFIGSAAAQAFPEQSELINGISSAVGSTLAGFTLGGPAGAIAGGAFGLTQLLSSVDRFRANRRFDTETGSRNLESARSAFDFNSQNFQAFQQALGSQSEARASGDIAALRKASEDLLQATRNISDPELAQAIRDSVGGASSPEEIQQALGRAFKSFQDRQQQDLGLKEVELEIKNLIKENRNNIAGFNRGLGLDREGFEDLARRIAQTVDIGSLSQSQRASVRQASINPEASFQDIFNVIGRDAIGSLISEGNAMDNTFQTLVATAVNARIEMEKVSGEFSNLASSQINVIESSKELIKTFSELFDSQERQRRSTFETAVGVARESLNNPLINETIKTLAEAEISRAQILEDSLSQVKEITKGLSTSTLEKLGQSIGGQSGESDLIRVIEDQVRGGNINNLIAEVQKLNIPEQKDVLDQSLSQLRAIKQNSDNELERLGAILNVSFKNNKLIELNNRASAIRDKNQIENIVKALKESFNAPNQSDISRIERGSLSGNSATRLQSRGALNAAVGERATARVGLERALQEGGFGRNLDIADRLSKIDFRNLEQARKELDAINKDIEGSATDLRPDVGASLSSNIRENIIDVIKGFASSNAGNLGDTGFRDLSRLVDFVRGASTVEIQNTPELFTKALEKIISTRRGNGLLGREGAQDLNENAGSALNVLRRFSADLESNRFNDIVSAETRSITGGGVPTEVLQLQAIAETNQEQLEPLNAISSNSEQILSLLQTRLGLANQSVKENKIVSDSIKKISDAQKQVSELSDPQAKNVFDTQKEIATKIEKIFSNQAKNIYPAGGFSNQADVDFIKNLSNRNISFESIQQENPDLISRLQTNNPRVLELLKQRQSVPSQFVDSSGNFVNLVEKTAQAESNLERVRNSENLIPKFRNSRNIDFQRNALGFSSVGAGNAISQKTALERIIGFKGFSLDSGKISELRDKNDINKTATSQIDQVYAQLENTLKGLSGVLNADAISRISSAARGSINNSQITSSTAGIDAQVIEDTEAQSISQSINQAIQQELQSSAASILQVDTANLESIMSQFKDMLTEGANTVIEQKYSIDITGTVNSNTGQVQLSPEAIEKIREIIRQETLATARLNGNRPPMTR